MACHDLHRLAIAYQVLESGILAGRHFAEVGDALKPGSGITESFEDRIFGRFGYRLGKRTAAIQDSGGRFVQKRGRWDVSYASIHSPRIQMDIQHESRALAQLIFTLPSDS